MPNISVIWGGDSLSDGTADDLRQHLRQCDISSQGVDVLQSLPGVKCISDLKLVKSCDFFDGMSQRDRRKMASLHPSLAADVCVDLLKYLNKQKDIPVIIEGMKTHEEHAGVQEAGCGALAILGVKVHLP